jgi:hypothetical protein
MKTPNLVSLLRAVPALAAACALFSGGVALAQPSLSSIYPDGTVQFQYTNKLSFTLTSVAGITPAEISIQFYITNLSGVATSTNLTSTNGLTIGGSATSRVVTMPLTSNLSYTAIIQATDINGSLESSNVFDTVIPSYIWEAEDYDYNGGKFFDNPVPNAYVGLVATDQVDAHNPNGGGTSYRPINSGGDTGGDLGTEVNGDTPRADFVNAGATDYDVGWSNGGTDLWGNYTRHYPAGKWNIYMRGAGWAAPSESCDMLQGGGPSGTRLGEFIVPNSQTAVGTLGGTYQNYRFAPLTDIAGNLVEWDTDGSAQTLTLITVTGNWNANYFMLMPVNPDYKPVPYVSNVSPSGSQMFPLTNLFTFTANSVAGITTDGIVVTLNGIKPYGLTYTGSEHSMKATCPLATNVSYSVAITLTDPFGSSSYTTTFGTYSPSNYTFEVEDFDHDSGQFFDNPQVDAYAGLAGVDGVDAHNSQAGGTSYRSNDGGDLSTEVNGDAKRAQYTSLGTNDYDVGWTGAGQWGNYTRHYPAGVFNVQLRAAGNAGGADMARLLRVTSGVGTSSQTTTSLGQFNVPNTGNWQIYSWAPLVDANGNVVSITNSGGLSTLQLYQDNGGWNGNFLMFNPPDTTRPTISQIYPDGKGMFQKTNTLSFVASSTVNLSPSVISVTLNGVLAQNLSFSGPPTNLTVTCPLQPDTAYTATLGVNTTNNDPNAVTYFFDTFTTGHYTFEAEDWDYNGGKFIDNPQIDGYSNQVGVAYVDCVNTNLGPGLTYRPYGTGGDLGTETTGDYARAQFAGTNDYDVGWTSASQWANYTRTYPTGVFNVYLRGSSPSGVTDGASLLQVESGLGTSNQTTVALGQFNFPVTGGWQNYTWEPLVDSGGNMVTITNSGAVKTFRMYQVAGGWNANFLMLVPPSATAPKLTLTRSGSSVVISWAPASGTLLSSPALGATANWQAVANPTNPMTIPIGPADLYFRVKQ